MSDIGDFIRFIRAYIFGHVLHVGDILEFFKDFIVGIFLFKRGKYSISIINSLFVLFAVILTATVPIIAQNNPFQDKSLYNESTAYLSLSESIALDEGSISLDTYRSKIRDKIQEYTVLQGDTVESIAKKFDIDANTIIWANSLQNKKLTVGNSIKILPVAGVSHMVTPGDSIYSVAKKYGVKAQNIVNFPFNDFRDESFTLISGSTLIVPGGQLATNQNVQIQDGYGTFARVVEGVKGSSNFIWPTRGMITQYPTVYHMAFDIADSSAPPILASDAGTVIYSGCFSWGYGCHIIIDHNNGYRTLYGHLSRRDVEEGAVVSQGQQIGAMGSTGRSTGTHLHFEIRQGNTLLNPQLFLNR